YSLAFIALGLGSGSLGPTLPALAAQTNAGMKQISNLFIARSFGTMIGFWVIGRFYDRTAGHPLMASSLLASAVALALTPSVRLLPVLFILSAFMGIASASINVGGNALIALVHGERVRPFISMLHAAFGLGGLLAPMLIAQLIHRADSLHLTYWLLALVIIPVALITFLSPSPSLCEHKRLDSTAPLPTPMIALFAIFFFLQVGAEATVMGWYFSYATERGITAQTAAYLNSGFWAAFTLGRLATIWMSARFNAVSLIVMSLSIALLIALSLLILAPAPFVLWFGAIGLGLAVAPVFPNMFGLAQRLLGLSGKVTGFFLVGSSAGSMFWPWLTGQFFKSQGPQVMAWVVILNLLGALAILALLTSHSARAEGAQREHGHAENDETNGR
ncbi:MAG: MFS transporter, partial [Blastocatellia bacterium]